MGIKVKIPKGKTYGFFIKQAAVIYQTYTSGTSNFTDGKITIQTGTNIGYGGSTQANHPRQYCGKVVYRLQNIASNDAGVDALQPAYFCPGTQTVKAVVSNQGKNQITSVKVNWSKDGVLQSPVTYSSTLDTLGGSGSTSAAVTLGTHTFSANTPVVIKVWTSSPNSSADTVNTNDTLKQTVMPSLSGTFTVGGTTPNYTTLQAAINDLAKYGVCGPVTLSVASTTLTGRTVITAIPGASATNTITIKGAGKTSTTLTYASASTADMQTILLDGADYITFKDMTIANTGASNGFAIMLTNGADYNVIDGCNISVSTTATVTTIGGIAISGGTTSATTAGNSGNYNIIRNNTITGGYYGITVYGTGTASFVMGNQILNNTITNYYYYGTYNYYGGEAKMIGNTINTTRQASAYGMLFYYQSNFEVARNNINVPYYAMYCYYANYYLYNASGTKTTINNNILNSTGYYGYYAPYPYYLDFHYNTVRGNSTYAAYFANALGVSVKGNIFWNTSANYAFYSTAGTYSYVDYNIYYAPTAANPIYYNVNYASLSAWQAAVTQLNKNSWQQDPKLNSSSDLHISQTVTVPWGPEDTYTLDVDGDSRCRFAPTIGADESSLGKTQKPTAGMTAPDTVYVNSPTDFFGNQTPGVPHGNRWYVNDVLMKDSVDFTLTLSATGTYKIKVVAYGCQKMDSVTKTIIVANPSGAPTAGFLADKNLIKPSDIVTLSELSTGGATSLNWEITPAKTYDAGGNPIDRFSYVYGNAGSRTIKLRFDIPGRYKVCLTATNSIGSVTACKENYIVVEPSYNLGVTTTKINDSAGYIYDNGGPNGIYGFSLATSAVIAPCASEVYLIVKRFELECAWDYLRIYDGEDKTGKPLHPCTTNFGSANGPGLTGLSTGTCTSICRPAVTDTFKAKSGKMYLEMGTDGSGQYDGFEAYWWSKPKKVDPPKAEFDFPSTICVDIPVFFKNMTTGESVTYQWDLDDDMSQFETSSKDAAFMYFAAGKYVITLIASNCGGTDTVRHEITVIAPNAPTVAFTTNNLKPTTSDIVTFSPDIVECISDYRWRFTAASGPGKAIYMNGTKTTSMNPQVMFTDTGCYNVFLEAKNAGGVDSLEIKCYIKVKSPYCVPTVTTNIVDLGISEVTIADVNGKVLLSNKSTSGVEDYQNFVATVSTTLEAGVSYDLTMKRPSTLNDVTRTFWVDWNLDGDFADAGEKVGEQKKTSAQTWTYRFKVPKNVSTGASVMRVAINQGNLTNSVCGPNRYGEYEDYRIYLTPDLTPPVITLVGDDTVYVEQGYSYVDKGATAFDNLNGNITPLIKKKQDPTFNNMIPNTYKFVFDVSDSSGNQAKTVTRIVIVTPDATPPQLIVSGADTIHVDVFDNNYADPFAVLAEDLVDGDLLDQVLKAGAVDVSKVGMYTLTFSVADATGNTAVVTRVIIVGDNVPPVLTLIGSDPAEHEVNTAYVDAGVTYSDNYCTMDDMKDNLLMTSNVNSSRVGTYTVVYNLTDCNGNKAQITRTVIVKDTKAPELSLKGDSLIVLDVFDTYTSKDINVSDNYGQPTVKITGSYYDNFANGKATALGDYTIVYTATDSFGNSSAVTRTIRVVDRTAPVITIRGVPTANVCRWAVYKDAGYDLADNYWDTSNIKVTREGDFVNTMLEGVFSMRYRAEDKSGNVGYSEWRIIRVTEAGEGGCITGLGKEDNFGEGISVFPNPTTGRFTISFHTPSQEQVSIKVINPLGQEIAGAAEGNKSAGTLTVDLTNHASGVYMLHIMAGNKTAVKRIVVSR